MDDLISRKALISRFERYQSDCEEENDIILPFETLQAKVTCGELDKAIVAVISDEFGGLCSVGLNKQYADLYLVDGGNDND